VIILGIDPGTIVTGYGVIRLEDGKYMAVDYGSVNPPAKFKLTDRYLIIYEALEQLIDKYKPDACVIETQFVSKNVQSAIKLGMARGVVIVAAKKRGVSVFEYAPTKAKNAVCGNGSASKAQVQKMVQLLLALPRPPEPEDAADALALAICHANSLRYQQICEMEI
jgi:crossover junction endodeoxyribonuclease RuvC